MKLAQPDYKPTNNVLDAERGQIEDSFSGDGVPDLGQVVLFDSSLNQAIADHLGDGVNAGMKSVIMVSFNDVIPENSAGDALSLRDGILLDMYVLVRSSGRTRYNDDRMLLNDLCDHLWRSAFHYTNTRDEYKDHVGAMRAVTVRRQDSGDGILARLIQFVCIPQRT